LTAYCGQWKFQIPNSKFQTNPKSKIPNLIWNLKHLSLILLLDTLFPSAYDEEMVEHPKINPVSKGEL